MSKKKRKQEELRRSRTLDGDDLSGQEVVEFGHRVHDLSLAGGIAAAARLLTGLLRKLLVIGRHCCNKGAAA
jgi:hypothetical protein